MNDSLYILKFAFIDNYFVTNKWFRQHSHFHAYLVLHQSSFLPHSYTLLLHPNTQTLPPPRIPFFPDAYPAVVLPLPSRQLIFSSTYNILIYKVQNNFYFNFTEPIWLVFLLLCFSYCHLFPVS